MINIIESLWQAEVKGARILPTVVKLKGNTPKNYFFSDKQMRVLRKKEQSTEMGMQTLGIGKTKDEANRQCLKIKMTSAKKIEFQVILDSEVNGLLLNSQENFSLVAIQSRKQINRLIECRYDFVYDSFRSKELMRNNTPNRIWRSPTLEEIEEIANEENKKLQDVCTNLAKDLCLKLKITSKCQLIDVIIATNQSLSQQYIVWSNNFKFSQPQFFSISYELVQSHELPSKTSSVHNSISTNSKNSPQKHHFSPIKHMITMEQAKPSQELNFDLQKQQNCFTCWGCGKKSSQATCKQLPNQEIIPLRRKNRLSIMGIFEQYLAVCLDCYENSDS